MSAPLVHRGDPETSATAAAALERGATRIVRDTIVDLLRKRPRSAYELTTAYIDLAALKDLPWVKPDSVAKRLSELHNEGVVEDSGQRMMGGFNRPVVVWQLTAEYLP